MTSRRLWTLCNGPETNLKCDGPTDGLIEVGARDADASKKDNERNLCLIFKM